MKPLRKMLLSCLLLQRHNKKETILKINCTESSTLFNNENESYDSFMR